MFSTPIPVIAYVLLSISFIGILAAFFYGWSAYIRTARQKPAPLPADDSGYPSASVIVYADCSEELLENTLDSLVLEDYPDFEIIVVCELDSDQAAILRERYAHRYKNVYVTFIPPGSHNVSRRKLAITTGVKAAKGEIIVTTCGNIDLPDTHCWLKSLLSPFHGPQGKYTDISLGVSKFRLEDLKGPGKWYRQFDMTLGNALWIGYALNGRPFRGDGNNLAFRRSTFIEHKGYSRTTNIHNGDDDLFLREIANSANTKTVVSPESIITITWPEGANKIWSDRKEGYIFTSRLLPKAPFLKEWCADILQWIIPGCAVAGLITTLPNLIGLIIGIFLILLFWTLEIILYRAIASKLMVKRLWMQVVPFWIWRIAGNLIFLLLHYREMKLNYTWVR